jgi:hypothetical protein
MGIGARVLVSYWEGCVLLVVMGVWERGCREDWECTATGGGMEEVVWFCGSGMGYEVQVMV